MRIFKKMYHYFFYKIYKSIEYTSELSGGKFLSAFKASLVMITLEIWILLSLGIYYTIITKIKIELSISMPIIYIPLIIIISIDYFIFHNKNQWKNIILKFDKLTKKRNIIGGWIVCGVVVLIITNLIFSFYLFYQT